jgi:hypothetical protein
MLLPQACAQQDATTTPPQASSGSESGSPAHTATGAATASNAGAAAASAAIGGSSAAATAAKSASRSGAPAGGRSSAGTTAASAGAAGQSGSGHAADGGVQMRPYKGVANSPCAARTALNVSWYYNWTEAETEACSTGVGGEFVPMIWGQTGDEQTAASIKQSVEGFVTHGYQNVLGFNEPDNSSQSNIPVATALSLWPSFDVAGIRIGSPGTQANANPGQAWFNDFMKQLNADSTLRTDFLALHWYGWNSGSCDNKASQLESYLKWAEGIAGNRPIWITEWGCLNDSAPDTATVVQFYKAAIAMFERHPRLERYAFYPWSTNNALNNKDGSLTDLGVAYAAAPAYR